MAYIKNKQLYVLNDSNKYARFQTIDEEVFLTSDYRSGTFSFGDFYRAIKFPLAKRVVRVYLLNSNETIYKDITEYVVDGSVSMSYENGKTRNGSLTLMNFNGEWMPSPVKGTIWKGTKFRIDIGISWNGKVFWKKFGIFVATNPSIDETKRTISIQLDDKFGLLDGSISGVIDGNLKITAGTNVKTAIESCIQAAKVSGALLDDKSILFPTKHLNTVTPYTITKTTNLTVGEVILELADMIFCDIYYNENGQLTVVDGMDNMDLNTKPILWNYIESDLSYCDHSISLNFTDVINKVIVLGSIEGGAQYKGVAINDNPKSQSNVYMTIPKIETIEDSNIIGDTNCQNRADYELSKKSRAGVELKYKSIFIPNLLPNEVVTWSNKRLGLINEKFIINSIKIDLVSNTMVDLTLSNLNEIAL